jgi:hypothetical protein
MKLSEMIEEYVDLKIAGEPVDQHWQSLIYNNQKRQNYHDRLQELKNKIDMVVTELK